MPKFKLKRLTAGLTKAADIFIGRQKIFIISHPKAGRTWLRVALGKIISLELNVSDKIFTNGYGKDIFKKRLPRIHFAHLQSTKVLNGSLKFEPNGKKIVLLIRDPRDLVVSYYYQMTRRKNKFEGTLSKFIRNRKRGIPKIIQYMNITFDYQNQCDQFLLISYEQMKDDLGNVLEQISESIGVSCHKENIGKTVQWSTLENMKSKAFQDHYNSGILAQKNDDDPNSQKVRKGKVGGYKEELSKSDIDYIEDYMQTHLHKDLLGLYAKK